MKKVLLVVDVQKGLLNDNPHDKDQFLTNLNDVINYAHEKEIEVIYVRHQSKVGTILEFNTDGWKISSKFQIKNFEQIIDKKYNSAFKGTMLDDYLQDNQISDLFIVGMQTELCIDSTIHTAFELGYNVHVIKECHTTFDNDYMKAIDTINYYENYLWNNRFAKIISIDDFKKN